MSKLEHVGIAVEDADRTIAILTELLGVQPYKTETVEREGVATHFIMAGATKLELLASTSPDSPIARHIEKRGQGLHHLAFEVNDIDAEIVRLRDSGFRPLSDRPMIGADDKRIVFFHPRDTAGILIELCQSKNAPPDSGDQPIVRWADSGRGRLVVLTSRARAESTIVLGHALEPFFDVVAVDTSRPEAVASLLTSHAGDNGPLDIVMLSGAHADEPEVARMGGNSINSIFMINPGAADVSSARALSPVAGKIELVFGGAAPREMIGEALGIGQEHTNVTCCVLPSLTKPLDVPSAKLLAGYLSSIRPQR